MTRHLIEGKEGPWEVVIGLEIHAQISSKAKLFSSAPTYFGSEPNANVSFVDAAFPGMLPVINIFCVEQGIKTGLGLQGTIHLQSLFDRKNYFYADLPSGYQISQYTHPLVTQGFLDIELPNQPTTRIGITRIHLEQDAGKSIHDQHPQKSFIDLNRSGIALMEIVTEPDLRSADEAMECVKKLRSLMRYLDTCDGNMEQGSLRADVNVSLRRPGEPLGTRAEIKNVNSIRFMGQAIHYEIQRQRALLEDGDQVIQETRLFDPHKGMTRSMRGKENANDYRYFPDPDLPPLVLTQEFVESIRKNLPELPFEKKNRFMTEFHLNAYDADLITSDKDIALFYETALKSIKSPSSQSGKLLANWLTGDFFAALNRESLTIDKTQVSPEHLGQLIELIENESISGKIAKDVFNDMWTTQKSPEMIVSEKGLQQITNVDDIKHVISDILKMHQDKVDEYRSGKIKLFGFFVGIVMKAMGGKANPALLNKLLKEALDL